MEIYDQSQEDVCQNAHMETDSENEQTLDWICMESDTKAVKKFEL